VVTGPAAVREQWIGEAGRWFPEAQVVAVRTRTDAANLAAALRGPGVRLVVISHELLPDAGPVLLRGRWDDVVCDEALLLRNPTSVRGRLLWQLRARADVAVALTGSPPGQQLGQVIALAAWCRDRPELLAAPPPASVADLAELLGPVLFRQDQRALDGEVDVTATEVLSVVPSSAEAAAAAAALARLAEALDEWRSAPKSRAARLRPAVTAALTAARAALSDPLAGAAGGSKRQVLVSLVADAHARGERVLVFTDMADSARAALADLSGAGVPAAALLGGQSPAARTKAVQAFLAGSLGALVVTPAGQEGLNLQVADVVVHLDLPLEVAPLLQRQSRARRIGGTASVRAVALVTTGAEETAARGVLAELAAELAGAGRLEGGAAGATALERADVLLGDVPVA
jgi:SNF2 family DNA or RNA helicase